jgi:hypothetical protein
VVSVWIKTRDLSARLLWISYYKRHLVAKQLELNEVNYELWLSKYNRTSCEVGNWSSVTTSYTIVVCDDVIITDEIWYWRYATRNYVSSDVMLPTVANTNLTNVGAREVRRSSSVMTSLLIVLPQWLHELVVLPSVSVQYELSDITWIACGVKNAFGASCTLMSTSNNNGHFTLEDSYAFLRTELTRHGIPYSVLVIWLPSHSSCAGKFSVLILG